jgi:hypothetical protein
MAMRCEYGYDKCRKTAVYTVTNLSQTGIVHLCSGHALKILRSSVGSNELVKTTIERIPTG